MRLRLLRSRRAATLDRRGRAIRQLAAALVLAVGVPAAVAARGEAPFARALQWTAPGAALPMLAEQPRQCPRADAPAPAATIAAGEALFNSPALLGGQASKAGLSCAACHRSGRDNPHFLMPQLSGAPGTADVTNSFFGPQRSNGRFDPVAIPDLAMPGKVSRAPDSPDLARFIRTLVVEEFSGAEPSPTMLDALAAYVRTIGACAAADARPQPRRLADQLRLIDQSFLAASAPGAADPALRRQLIAAARHQLGLIDERYAAPRHAALRRDLVTASRDLARIGDGDTGWRPALDQWHARFAAKLVPRLRQREAASLYDPAYLRRALAAPARAPD
ncbi:hypothetical protein [Sphingopyxis sp.]|uniref:hypothetical protein n=1 Tax=Sphingopyxis sp. TaxID=1908224 RepID=UPI003F725F31